MEQKYIDKITCCFDNECPLTEYYTNEQILHMIDIGSSELRALIAKALVFEENDDFAVSVLSDLTSDNDELVRIEATDSLSVFSNLQSFLVLQAALLDCSEVVRAYAAFGVAIVGKSVFPAQAIQCLLCRTTTEQSKYVLVRVYEGLYILGEKNYFTQLLDLFQENDYYIKRTVLHALGEILNKDNLKMIQSFVFGINSEISVAVNEELQKLKTTVENMEDIGHGAVCVNPPQDLNNHC